MTTMRRTRIERPKELGEATSGNRMGKMRLRKDTRCPTFVAAENFCIARRAPDATVDSALKYEFDCGYSQKALVSDIESPLYASARKS